MTDFDPGKHSVSELEDELQSIGTVEALESLLAAEKDGDDRKTAKDAIEARIEAVAGGGTATSDGASADGATTTDEGDSAATGDAGGGLADTFEGIRTSASGAATGLVGRSRTLDRLFGDDLAEPVVGTAGSLALLAVLVVGSLWPLLTVGVGSLLWTALVTVASLFATALVVLVAASLVDVEARWLGGGLVAAAYASAGVGLYVVVDVLMALVEGGPLLGFIGQLAPMAAVLSIQAAALALVYEAFSRPVLPAAELDGAAPRAASLHVANWWRVAGLGVVFELLLVFGIPVWFSAAPVPFGGGRAALLFVPTAGAVAAVLLYVLRKAAVVEQAVADG